MAKGNEQIQIDGPLWSATGRILTTDAADGGLALRTLFVANGPRKRGNDWFYLPGTVLALCAVGEVNLQLGKRRYTWHKSSGGSLPSSSDELRDKLRSGELSLLLLRADPDRAQSHTYTCVAGEIGLPEGGPEVSLYEHLGLERSGTDQHERLPGLLAVHASGVWLPATVALPWHAERVAAIFRLGPESDLSIEHELLTAEERRQLNEAWRNLGKQLNPRNPAYGLDSWDVDGAMAWGPTWVTLDLANPNALPHLIWPVAMPQTTSGVPKRGNLALRPGEISLILSDRHPSDQRHPPTTLAEIPLRNADVEKHGPNRWQISARTDAHEPDGVRTRLRYTASELNEEITLSPHDADEPLTFAFDPVQVPRWIRQQQGLPTPAYIDPPADTPSANAVPVREAPVLWGCVPLANGWMQMPIPNLTEQIYVDAGLETAVAKTPEGVLRGAVAYGYRGEAVKEDSGTLGDLTEKDFDKPHQQPWNIFVTAIAHATGTWSYDVQNSRLAVHLDIADPDVTLNGFFWLAAGRLSVADALPDLTDWVAGLHSVPLRLATSSSHPFRPVGAFSLSGQLVLRRSGTDESPAHLDPWSLTYELVADLYAQLTRQATPPLPVAWLRHPTLPMIQALPLTQNRWPPNHPSASRQLVPFTLKSDPASWTLQFGVSASTSSAAASWPRVQSDLSFVEAWGNRHDLPLAALSLPGLVLGAKADLDAPGVQDLSLQYRHDLPYTDELNALAALPARSESGTAASGTENAATPGDSVPLTPETYAAYWEELSRRASLAALDAVNALEDEHGTQVVKHLVEPYPWPAQVQANLDSYPGQVSFTQNGQELVLAREAALRGISGLFVEDRGRLVFVPGDSHDAFLIDAGSLAAHLNRADGSEPQGMRDQRGLVRQHTTQTGPILTTPLALIRDDPDAAELGQQVTDNYVLVSTLEPVSLGIGASALWRFWFRDLPLKRDAGQAQVLAFERHRSEQNQDVNDPEALARDQNFRQGYEWRLSGPSPDVEKPLTLKGLHLFPLTLEQVHCREDGEGTVIEKVVLTARLQIPLAGTPELGDLANVVQLTFVRSQHGLFLQELKLAVEAPAQAPLAVRDGEPGNAPRFEFGKIAYDSAADRVTMSAVLLHFVLLENRWTLPLGEKLHFPPQHAQDRLVFRAPGSGGEQTRALALREVAVTVDMKTGTYNHSAVANLDVSLGQRTRPILTATLQLDLLNEERTVTPTNVQFLAEQVIFATKPEGTEDEPLTLTPESLALSWHGYEQHNDDVGLQLLPGMDVVVGKEGVAGYAVLTFIAQEAAQADDGSQAWDYNPTSGFVETLLPCRWGELLLGEQAATVAPEQLFSPSAGDLTAAYTARWQGGNDWDEGLLLNGILEVRNLISWPLAVEHVQGTDEWRLPALAQGADLGHVRHTIRVLLNQHTVPGQLLKAGAGALLFDLGAAEDPGLDTQEPAWEFLAVVEHQLVAADASGNLGDDERRWTVVQEVRLLPRPSFSWFLDALDRWKIDDPTTRIGYFESTLRENLKTALHAVPPDVPLLLVEGSAHFWIAPEAIDAALTADTNLQFLPGGNTLALLSSPQDYLPAKPDDVAGPMWSLLTLPFLGRLCATPKADEPLHALLHDPIELLRQPDVEEDVRALAAAMANRGVGSVVTVHATPLDQSAGRGRPRLDTSSLEESWRRLYEPPVEMPSPGIQSVLAAFPDSPARLSRSVLMEELFKPERTREETPAGVPEAPDRAALAGGVTIVPVQLRNGGFEDAQAPARHPFHRPGQDNSPFGDSDAVPAGWKVFEAAFRGEILSDETPDWGVRYAELKAAAGGKDRGVPRFRFPLEVDQREADTYRQLYELREGSRAWLIYTDGAPIRVSIGQRIALKPGDYVFTCWIVPVQTGEGGIPDPLPEPVDPGQLAGWREAYRAKWRPPDGDSRVSLVRDGVAQGTRDGRRIRFHRRSRVQWRFTVSEERSVKLGILLEGNGNWQRNGWIVDDFSLVQLVPEPPKTIEHPEWRPDSLLTVSSGARVTPSVPGWHALGPLLMSSQLWPRGGAQDTRTLTRFAAATLLPTRPGNGFLPVGLAVSPYLGLGFRPAPETARLQMVVAELLCHAEGSTGGNANLVPVASRVWEWPKPDEPSDLAAEDVDVDWPAERQAAADLAVDWARELHRRLYPYSPIAVLRLRLIRAQLGPKVENDDVHNVFAPVITSFAFRLLTDLAQPVRLAHQVAPLRAQAEHLRFREGQFGGYAIPRGLEPFEMAPPQVTALQPIYLSDGTLYQWPWGLSALRVIVRYTQANPGAEGATARGTVGALEGPGSIWWQAPQHQVQFRSVTSGAGPTAGLPKNYRAPAIRSLLPVVPGPEMPKTIDIDVEPPPDVTPAEPTVYRWQSVLPGALRFMLLGNRAGAMLALRHQLLRQSLNENGGDAGVTVSGSIPVQHRVPRPVPLLENRPNDRSHALQTWASYFEPQKGGLVTDAPADEAFFATSGLAFTITEATLQAVRAVRPDLDLEALAKRDVLNLPIAGLDALRGTLEDKLSAVAKEVAPLFARFAERSYGAGRVEFRVTDDTLKIIREAGFDLTEDPYDKLKWEDVRDKTFARFSEISKNIQLLAALHGPDGKPIVDPVEFGAFVNLLYEHTRRPYGAGRVMLQLQRPTYGEIGPDWTGELQFRAKSTHELDDVETDPSGSPRIARWNIELSADVNRRQLVWKLHPDASDPANVIVSARLSEPTDEDMALEHLRRWLGERRTGDVLTLEARVTPQSSGDQFTQELRFPLRFVEKDVLPLPLAPTFVHFEDPEYNRLLATPAAQASIIVSEGSGDSQQVHTVTLAADRKRYNPVSVVHLRFDWDDERRGDEHNAELRLDRISGEVPEGLSWGGHQSRTIRPGELILIPLSALRLADRPAGASERDPLPSVDWRQGEVLQLTLQVAGDQIQLRVPIVSESVEPAPETGYALLRCQVIDGREEVECVRFAFGPPPARIDLISADDLRQEIVRRRALFQWIDVARRGTVKGYAVQKITHSGSTHFPQFADD